RRLAAFLQRLARRDDRGLKFPLGQSERGQARDADRRCFAFWNFTTNNAARVECAHAEIPTTKPRNLADNRTLGNEAKERRLILMDLIARQCTNTRLDDSLSDGIAPALASNVLGRSQIKLRPAQRPRNL